MHRQRRTKDLSGGQLIVVVLLLLCFLSTSLSLSSLYKLSNDTDSKAPHGWAKRETQIPFEEKEKGIEEKADEKHQFGAYLLALIRELAHQPTRFLSNLHSNAHHDSLPGVGGVPIYITHRSFLI
jgi:hypothetical protein